MVKQVIKRISRDLQWYKHFIQLRGCELTIKIVYVNLFYIFFFKNSNRFLLCACVCVWFFWGFFRGGGGINCLHHLPWVSPLIINSKLRNFLMNQNMNSLRDLQLPIKKNCVYDIRFREAVWRFSFNAGNQRHALRHFGQWGGGPTNG